MVNGENNSFYFLSDRDRLFYTVYEKKAVTNQGIAPSLWTYRSRITLEHLTHMLVKNKNCTMLQGFLKEVREYMQFSFYNQDSFLCVIGAYSQSYTVHY